MKSVKSFVLTAILLFGATVTEAQDKVAAVIKTDIVNNYIWRGQDLGNVSLQPTLGVEYKGLALTAWGSVGLAEASDTKEFDLTLSYTIGGLNIGLTDYWFNANGGDPKNRYFMYKAHSTNHVFEANIGYDFGPASVQLYTNFAGNDGLDDNGGRAYSSYAEVNVPFRLGGLSWTATVGAVPYATSFYSTDGFAVTNVSLKAVKELQMTDKFSVPVFAGVSANPCAQKAYMVVGFTLEP